MSKAMERGVDGPDAPTGGRRFWVGSIECRIVSDGTGLWARDQIAAGGPDEGLVPLIGDQTEENGMVRRPCNCLLVRSGDRFALIDTGLGRLAVATGVPAGRMLGSLREMGLAPSDIEAVVISHAHPAHIGSLTREGSQGRVPTFGASRHWFWRAEWEFWTSEERLAELPERLAGPARLHLPVLQHMGLVHTAEEETEVLPGVRLLPAPGHTPGHMAVTITSGRHGAIYVGDAVPHELSLEHPEWVSATDLLPDLAIRTRKALIDRARRERRLIVASHLAAPLRLRPPRTRAETRERGS